MVLFTDGKLRSSPATYFMPDPWLCWTPSLTDEGPVTLADALNKTGKAVDNYSFDFKRHRERINIAFADGHVATLRITSADMSKAYLLPK